MTAKTYNEATFEDNICSTLDDHGYERKYNESFNKKTALMESELIEFIRKSQPKVWKKLHDIYGEETEKRIIERITDQITSRGMIDVIRHGVEGYGQKIEVAIPEPTTTHNEERNKQFKENRFSYIRQLNYNIKNDRIDIVIFLNGLPIISKELKTEFTNQTVEDAKKQYMQDRDPDDLLFKNRVLVNFAIDTNEIYMTTKLKGNNTKFLPFNKGTEQGSGNPANPHGYRTDYLWKKHFQKKTLLDILFNFIYVEKKTTDYGINEKTIFPRYHQYRAVTKVTEDIKKELTNKKYLIQHSPGSGKSLEISWTAHRLATMHIDDEKAFQSVIVVTDRKNLDQQLKQVIKEFEHKPGMIAGIDKGSKELLEHIKKGTLIIISTLQKFEYITDEIKKATNKNRRYLIIADEAHRSQTGEMIHSLHKTLSNKKMDDDLSKEMETRPLPKNLTLIGFTATPKETTLKSMGIKGKDGEYRPFDIYSMKQAIEEGFILDVLQTFTEYQEFYEVAKKTPEDPEYVAKKANKTIKKYVKKDPKAITEKVKIIIEHFKENIKNQIGGKAKAMVVTSGREEVVKYGQIMKEYVKSKKYGDIGILVAFSNTVTINGEEYTETSINNISEEKLKEEFRKDKYKILIVADKYQTGYDEPLLYAMYVDKRLDGIKSVQTLNRLNRTHPGKDGTFIMDFVNKRNEIIKDFEPYYKTTILETVKDPNQLYDRKREIMLEHDILRDEEIDQFCEIYFAPFDESTRILDHPQLNQIIDKAINRYHETEDVEKKEFKRKISRYHKRYAHFSQVMLFQDKTLEKLYTYIKFLITKLPRSPNDTDIPKADEVELLYYKAIKENEYQEKAKIEGKTISSGTNGKNTGNNTAIRLRLSKILNEIAKKTGLQTKTADKIFLEQIEQDCLDNPRLKEQSINKLNQYKYSFKEQLNNIMIDRMEQNQAIFETIMADDELLELITEMYLNRTYKKFKETKKNKKSNNKEINLKWVPKE